MYDNRLLKWILSTSIITILTLILYIIFFLSPAYNNYLVKETEKDILYLSKYLTKTIKQKYAYVKQTKNIQNYSFDKDIKEIENFLNFFKMTIYADSGEIIFSSNEDETGQVNKNSYFYSIVSKGKSYSTMLHYDKKIKMNIPLNHDVVEIYIPVMKNQTFLGAFEILYDITEKKTKLNSIVRHFYVVMGPILICLLVLLIVVTNKADQSIKKVIKIEQEANSLKNEFIASMTHELKTPLTSIIGFSSIGINRTNKDPLEVITNYFHFIKNAGDKMLPLVNDILDLSKLKAGKMNYNMKPNHILKPIRYVIKELKPIIEEKNLVVQIKHSDISVNGFFDYDRISQVIRNILSNAIKFSLIDGVIDIDITKGLIPANKKTISTFQLESLIISITNHGVQIPVTDFNEIFKPFFQSKLHNKHNKKGTGLGLSISKKIINDHRGRIWFNSKKEGTTFFFSIPLHHPVKD